jgi:hypothetical protein
MLISYILYICLYLYLISVELALAAGGRRERRGSAVALRSPCAAAFLNAAAGIAPPRNSRSTLQCTMHYALMHYVLCTMYCCSWLMALMPGGSSACTCGHVLLRAASYLYCRGRSRFPFFSAQRTCCHTAAAAAPAALLHLLKQMQPQSSLLSSCDR